MAPPTPEQLNDLALDLQVELEPVLGDPLRVLNGGTPDGAEWHRRLLERMGQATDQRPAVFTADTTATPMSCNPNRWSAGDSRWGRIP